jgi:hypothetical protein
MNALIRSIKQIVIGAIKAFETYPATIAFAFAFSVVTMVRIQLDWPEQEAYNFLFNCLHWTFAFGAIFSLTAITAAKIRFDGKKPFLIANVLSIIMALIAFFLLYTFGLYAEGLDVARSTRLSNLAVARVTAAIAVSFISFILLVGQAKERSDFSHSFFMTHKAFFTAWIYGMVIMGGASAVAGAIQALLYNDMSVKVYEYIGTLTGFFAFTIFVGYFPDFTKDHVDERLEIVQKQPRFAEILFSYIMVPIALAMTAVLLLWVGRTVFSGISVSFNQLSGIATGYAAGGLWLYIMVTHHENGLAKFYRMFFPIATLIILAIEAWAIYVQIDKFGIKTLEYSFLIMWFIAVSAAILLILKKAKAQPIIAMIFCTMIIVSVMPIVGYHALPVTSQSNRLETLLIEAGMLVDGKIVPAATDPTIDKKEAITDSVMFLVNAQDAKLPAWFDRDLNSDVTFLSRLGFKKVWPTNNVGIEEPYTGTYLTLPNATLDIGDYNWVIKMQIIKEGDQMSGQVVGARGTYQIDWVMGIGDNVPSINIDLDGKIIVDQDLNAYLDDILIKYPPGRQGHVEATQDDMTLVIDTPEIRVLLVFSQVDINIDNQQDRINYWIGLSDIYLYEKP